MGALLVSSGGTVAAETVSVVGTNGTDGPAGAPGDPGSPGLDGLDGATATALADALFEGNTATAIGGNGGRGGDGGGGSTGGADGGDGGNGGNGGHAIAEASTVGANVVHATATGGYGGDRGGGGPGSSPGVDGEPGQIHGRGGDATASATIEQNFIGGGPLAALDGRAYAVAGNGLSSAGLVGNAHASISGEATGDGSSEASHVLSASARRSNSRRPGPGGDAHADATGSTTHGSLRVQAVADAGSPPSMDGGTAIAVASGSHSGSGELDVFARAQVDDPLDGFGAGIALPTASGVATGGADVRVTAVVTAGRDTELRDVVSGSTSGMLTLNQINGTPSGFEIGPFRAGISGTSRTSLVAENVGGGDLDMNIFVNSVAATSAPEDGLAILGDIIGRSNNGSNVDVGVTASANIIRQQDLDDPSRASRIFGASNGGDVSVQADFRVGGDGYSVVMADSVAGETTGNLALGQNATAGSGGDAINRLTSAGSYESLTLSGFSLAGHGGAATLFRDATNDAGGIDIQGYARAGVNGGDAIVDVRATTFGDGHSITIGQEPDRPMPQGAIAGRGGGFPSGFSPATTTSGRGGRAESHSAGLAYGDSEVDVYDLAVAGTAGGPGFGAPISGFAGAGGDAVSSAYATGGGVSRTAARSEAKGGGSGFSPDSGGDAGDADATAYAGGLGEAQALAIAIGGSSGSTGVLPGSARASAEALGAMGIATADAATGDGLGARASFRAMVQRDTDRRTRVEAIATYAGEFPNSATGNKGMAFITGTPHEADVRHAVRRHDELGSLLEDLPAASVEALGQWSARGRGREPSTQLVELDITLAPPETPSSDLILAVFALDASGGGFESLRFRLEVFGELFGEEMVFDDLSAAKEYFATLIGLGDAFLEPYLARGVPAVRAIFDVTIGDSQNIEFGLAVVVTPEPSTAVLLGFGLMFVASRRHGARFKAHR